jgi:hypothetical protein
LQGLEWSIHMLFRSTILTAKAHRPAYGTDGDYFSKPSVEDMVEAAYGLMSEGNPKRFPELF